MPQKKEQLASKKGATCLKKRSNFQLDEHKNPQKMTSTSLPTSTKLNDKRFDPWLSIEYLYINDKNGFREEVSEVTGNDIPALLTKWEIPDGTNKKPFPSATLAEKREWKSYTQFFSRFIQDLHKNHGLPKEISEQGKYSIVLLLH